ncbi:MAG TPA: hypothetical protein VEW03_04080 [Longimicrobiaceae bacterium]|nr:hypothetical protein [Longimicrobiaceae bacterium]
MPRILLPALVAVVLLGSAVPPAVAQCLRNRSTDTIVAQDTVSCRYLQLPSPDANAVRGVVPAGFVTADKDDSEVQIQAGKRLRPHRWWGQLSLTATATAPLADGPLSPLAELRGALPGTALELSLTGVRWPRVPPGTGDAAVAWCKRQNILDCTSSSIEEKHPTLLDEFKRVSGFRRPLVYQLSVNAAYDEHDFVDETTLEEGSRRLVPFTLSGTYGRFLGATLLTINGRYERRFEDGDEIEICSPVGVGSAERCETAHLGEPGSASTTVITGQARRFLSPSTAMNGRVAYRVEDEAWSVETPFYFIPNGDGALIGGIVPGWSSKDKEFTVRLFVGRAFGLRAN